MNKRLEEKLAMLAFGDMSPEEMTRLEQEVAGDREAMRVLADYRGMRSGLRALSDIPEHQLSTERLRSAVLNRGLKPKARPQLGWLWMPATACALFFGVTMLMHRSQTPMLPGAGGLTAADVPSVNLVPDRPENVFAFATASSEILSVASPRVRQTLVSNSHTRRREDHRIADLKDAVMRQFESQLSDDGQGAKFALKSAGVGDTRPVDGTIVCIGSAKDGNTGAQKATEVDSASNVVVGG